VTRARHIAATCAAGLAIGVGGALALGAGSGGGGYLVRAVFDNASFVIPGEDVKIAGVKAGTVQAVELTAGNKAAVVLRIDDPALRPFRSDAHCDIRLQSLIGEQYVECAPTRPRADGAPVPGELAALRDGAARGQHLLPVTQTSSPVGVDLLNDIMRLPEQQRFRLIIGELGAGLAANGDELRAALRRADPALAQTTRVVSVLAAQDTLLGRLVDESNRDLAPLAAQRRHVGGFIDHAGATGAATAQRGADLEADLHKLPAFLAQLTPAADRFSALADQMTPALDSLHAQAPAINAAVKQLGSFSQSATPALVSLGRVADQGRQTFPKIKPLADQLGALAAPLRPVAQNIAGVAASFDQRGGIESVMRFIYSYTGAVNGEDALGHYIRSLAEIGQCSARQSVQVSGCESSFDKTGQTYKAGNPARDVAGAQAIAARAARDAGVASAPPSAALLDYLLGSGATK
jgi:phospholipid/cholesterol/gamma-HCH transport system substrate-binding protein